MTYVRKVGVVLPRASCNLILSVHPTKPFKILCFNPEGFELHKKYVQCYAYKCTHLFFRDTNLLAIFRFVKIQHLSFKIIEVQQEVLGRTNTPTFRTQAYS
jgi:hypothetical protein